MREFLLYSWRKLLLILVGRRSAYITAKHTYLSCCDCKHWDHKYDCGGLCAKDESRWYMIDEFCIYYEYGGTKCDSL